MVILERLRLFQFRCYEETVVEPDERFNVITGLNGQGKTSVLEAIGLVTSLRSLRGAKNSEMLRLGAPEGRVSATIRNTDLTAELDVKVYPTRKHATFNGKTCRYLSEYIGKVSSVSFSPSDLEIVRGAPENRRSWVDRLSQTVEPAHADAVARFHKILEQRNRLLRTIAELGHSRPPEELAIWSQELVEWGSKILYNRLQAIESATPIINQRYGEIAGRQAAINVRYESAIFGQDRYGQASLHSLELIARLLENALRDALPRELIVGSTLVGPQRDELEFTLDGKLVKAFGSQGEARSLVLAMRLTEVELHKLFQKMSPIVLIDDFSSELDAERRTFLLEYLAMGGSQVFLSTTEDLRIGKVFEVKDGRVFPTSPASPTRMTDDGRPTHRSQ